VHRSRRKNLKSHGVSQQSVAEILASLNFGDDEKAKAWQELQEKAAKLDEQLRASNKLLERYDADFCLLWLQVRLMWN